MKTTHKVLGLVTALWLLATFSAQAGIDYTNIVTLGSTLGSSIRSAGVLRSNVLYYACYSGGSSGAGTILKYDVASSAATVLFTFSPFQGTNGTGPSGLVLLGETLYGTTSQGGTNASYGIVFKIGLDGTFTKLRNFGGTIGNEPVMRLCALGNLLYGSTPFGGANNLGAMFCIDTNGTTQWVQALDSSIHNLSEIIPVGDYLFSASYTGGAHGDGSIVRIKKDGTGLTNLFSFSGTDGAYPVSLTIGPDGRVYGTTRGEYGESLSSIFAINTNGAPTTIATVDDPKDYFTGVSFGPNGLMYAVTAGSGTNNNGGCVYQVGTNGSLLRLLPFPYASPTVTKLYVSPITFGDDGVGYFGFKYTNALGRLSIPQWTVFESMRLTCSNTVYTWRSVAGQAYNLRLLDTLNGQWSNHIMTATAGVSEYAGEAVTGKPSEFGRVTVFTTNTMAGFDVAMTNGAIMQWHAVVPIEQRDTNCITLSTPCTNNCPPPSGPPSLP